MTTINEFGVTQAVVASDYFPQWNGSFSTASKPTAARVAVIITEEAANLGAKLYAENITPSSITTDATSIAYVKCQAQLKRMVALRIFRTSTQQNPELAKALQAESMEWFKQLASEGGTFLGDEALDTGSAPADGPTTHINQFSLETDDADDMSTTVPQLRKDDQL